MSWTRSYTHSNSWVEWKCSVICYLQGLLWLRELKLSVEINWNSSLNPHSPIIAYNQVIYQCSFILLISGFYFISLPYFCTRLLSWFRQFELLRRMMTLSGLRTGQCLRSSLFLTSLLMSLWMSSLYIGLLRYNFIYIGFLDLKQRNFCGFCVSINSLEKYSLWVKGRKKEDAFGNSALK